MKQERQAEPSRVASSSSSSTSTTPSSSTTTTTTATATATATTTVPNNNNNNNINSNINSSSSSTKARGQTVNGKPLALDVSSLIGKPTTSSSSEVEVPLNLSMKTSKDGQQEAASGSGSQSARLGRGVSVPKKNTVASLLAQSRNQRSSSPVAQSSPQAAHAASNPNASEIKAMKDNLVSPSLILTPQ